MLRTPAFFLFALLLQQRHCNLASPEAIKGMAEDMLHPYFPNARVIANPQQQALIAFTCTQGVGPQLVAQLQQYIATDRTIVEKLSWVQLADGFSPLLGGAHYKYLLLGFDGGWVRYDIDTRQIATLGMAPQALQAYKQVCGFTSQ